MIRETHEVNFNNVESAKDGNGNCGWESKEGR